MLLLIFVSLFFGLLALFSFHNHFYLTLDLWPFDYHVKIFFPVVLGVSLLLGFLFGLLVFLIHKIPKREKKEKKLNNFY